MTMIFSICVPCLVICVDAFPRQFLVERAELFLAEDAAASRPQRLTSAFVSISLHG